MNISIVSGYFDPLHKGHLDLIRRARNYGKVVVIVNNNKQSILKKGKYFMDEIERAQIIYNLKDVTGFMISIDDDKTVCRSLESLRATYSNDTLFFVNGDEYKKCKEHKTCKKLGIILKYGEGKKIQSSSWLLKK